jgi:uncharacterized membrane protein YtjA (UPF0391 family)
MLVDIYVPTKEETMLSWAFSFLLLAIIAGFLGFGGVAVISVEIARVLFVLFLVLFAAATLVHVLRGGAPPAV